MRKNPYSGLYVVLEGIDCAGKGKQVALLKQSFDKLGLKVGVDYNFFAEPTQGCLFYDLIRSILVGKITATSIFLQEGMAANRDSFEIIFLFNSLQNVPLTIVDRSFYSNFAYYMADGGDFKDIMDLNKNRIIPDCTIFLNITAKESMRRLAHRKEKQIEIFEKKFQFAEELRDTYLTLLGKDKGGKKGDIRILDAMRSPEVVFQKVLRIIRRKAEEKGIFFLPKGRNAQAAG